jgi:integrase
VCQSPSGSSDRAGARGRTSGALVAGHTDAKGVYHPGALPASKHGLRFHDLRHTCASLGVASGANVKQVQEMLGHSSVTITLDRYSHLFPSGHEALAANLSATFAAAEAAPASVTEPNNVVAIGQ